MTETAFRDLYHSPKLRSLVAKQARKYGGSIEDREDREQEAWLRIWADRGCQVPEASVTSAIYGVYLREWRHRKAVEMIGDIGE